MASFEERIANIRAGDQQALDMLLARWRPILRLKARGMLGGAYTARVDSSDVVQETLTEIARGVGGFRGNTEGEWAAWVHRVLQGQAAKLRRFHRADKRAVTRDLPATGDVEPAPGADPAAVSIELEEIVRLASAIEDLSDPMQEVLIRRVVAQQPFNDVAKALDRSPGAVRVLWTRALRKLRESLAEASQDSSV